MANCDYALQSIETRPGPLGAETHIAGLIVRHHKTIVAVDQENKPAASRVARPIRRLRRADHHGGHGDAHLLPSLPPFVFFSSPLGPGRGGGLARTHGAFPRGANILSLRPKTPEGHMYSCASVGDASGSHSSIGGSRERMMRHLCICLRSAAALHKSTPPPRTHRPDHTSRC